MSRVSRIAAMDKLGSFKHSERYANVATRYTQSRERKAQVGVPRASALEEGQSGLGVGGENDALLPERDHLDRARKRKDAFRTSCVRFVWLIVVLTVFVAVAVVGFGKFKGWRDSSETPTTPTDADTDAEAARAARVEARREERRNERLSNETSTTSSAQLADEDNDEGVAAERETYSEAQGSFVQHAESSLGSALMYGKRERYAHKFRAGTIDMAVPLYGNGTAPVILLPGDP